MTSFRTDADTLEEILTSESEINLSETQWKNHILSAQSLFAQATKALSSVSSSIHASIHAKRLFLSDLKTLEKGIVVDCLDFTTPVIDCSSFEKKCSLHQAYKHLFGLISSVHVAFKVNMQSIKSANIVRLFRNP